MVSSSDTMGDYCQTGIKPGTAVEPEEVVSVWRWGMILDLLRQASTWRKRRSRRRASTIDNGTSTNSQSIDRTPWHSQNVSFATDEADAVVSNASEAEDCSANVVSQIVAETHSTATEEEDSTKLSDNQTNISEDTSLMQVMKWQPQNARLLGQRGQQERRTSNDVSPPTNMPIPEESDNLQLPKWQSATQRIAQTNSDLLIMRQNSTEVEVIGSIDRPANPFREYLSALACYDLAPKHNHIMVMDNRLSLRAAFQALVPTEDQSALVWDEPTNTMQGLFTKSDFLEILFAFGEELVAEKPSLTSVEPKTALDATQLFWWMQRKQQPLVSVSSDESVLDAVEKLCSNDLNKMPVFEVPYDWRGQKRHTSEPLCWFSLPYVLKRLLKQDSVLKFLPWTLSDLKESKLGTWGQKVETVRKSTTIADALAILVANHLSCLPVLDDDGGACSLLRKRDILRLLHRLRKAHEHHRRLSSPANVYRQFLASNVGQAIRPSETIGYSRIGAHKSRLTDAFCSSADTVLCVIRKLLSSHHDCLFVADDSSGELLAVVSCADIIQFLLR